MEFPEDLKYTKDHEWVRVEGDIATVGITAYAASELGDVVYVEVETIDETLNQEDAFGSIEAVKTVSDLFMPVSGTVLEFNEIVDESPETVNEDPYGEGWLAKVRMTNPAELDSLMDMATYKDSVGQ